MSAFVRSRRPAGYLRQASIFRTINVVVLSGILLVSGCTPLAGGKPSTRSPSTPMAGRTRTAIPTQAATSTPARPTATTRPQTVTSSLTFNPDADAYVKRSAYYDNFGQDIALRVDGGGNPVESFLRFTVPAIPGTVKSARLRLYTQANGSGNGPAVYAAGGSWSEKEITWDNRPAHEEDALDNKDQIGPETWVEYDVTSKVNGEGTFNFVVTADSKDAVSFSSREGERAPELVISFTTDSPPVPTATLSAEDEILVGAGDISLCSSDNDELTARLLDDIPGTVFTTGDNAYENGTAEEYAECYNPTWGRHKDRTHPTPGHRDYHTADASAYFQYFNSIPSYYAYDLGSWRVYALNSEAHVDEDSKQAKWLQLDLATHPNRCVLAYWHRPRWSSGSTHGSRPEMQVLWEILYKSGAELVINGFEHNYERFAPMDAEGQADPQGMREIVVGTGGAVPFPFGDPLPASEVRNNSTYGVLKLTLRADSYDWEFIPVPGSTFTDSGSAACH